MRKITLAIALLLGIGVSAQCTTWVNPNPESGWIDFNNMFGGAPAVGATNEITEFQVWQSEAYLVENFVQGVEYTFSMCNGSGAGSWVPDFTIIAPSGTIDAFGAGNENGCSITWVASESGTYLIVINEAGACGVEGGDDGGFPALSAANASIDNVLAGSFSVYPNPTKDMLNISNSIGAEINSVTITDINGRTVKQVTANGVESQINTADLNAGVYFVNINSNQGSLTKKIVKQ
jgi:hypothetical protein